MNFELDELAEFLVKAKRETYAGDGTEIEIVERPGFKELVSRDGPWEYRDSYSGYFMALGQEVVRHQEKPVWAMAYAGGMLSEYQENKELAHETFEHLKLALMEVSKDKPFRGPRIMDLKDGFKYFCNVDGDIKDFKGSEVIMKKSKAGARTIFRQNFIGGLIIGE